MVRLVHLLKYLLFYCLRGSTIPGVVDTLEATLFEGLVYQSFTGVNNGVTFSLLTEVIGDTVYHQTLPTLTLISCHIVHLRKKKK